MEADTKERISCANKKDSARLLAKRLEESDAIIAFHVKDGEMFVGCHNDGEFTPEQISHAISAISEGIYQWNLHCKETIAKKVWKTC